MTTGRINQVDTSQYRNEADTPLSLARRWRRATLAPGGPLTRSVFIIASPEHGGRHTPYLLLPGFLPSLAARGRVSSSTLRGGSKEARVQPRASPHTVMQDASISLAGLASSSHGERNEFVNKGLGWLHGEL